MQDKIVLLPISLEELETLIQRVMEKSIQNMLGETSAKAGEELLTTQQVCAEFNVSRTTLIKYHKQGKLIPNSKSGKQHTYKRSDCQKAFLHKSKLIS